MSQKKASPSTPDVFHIGGHEYVRRRNSSRDSSRVATPFNPQLKDDLMPIIKEEEDEMIMQFEASAITGEEDFDEYDNQLGVDSSQTFNSDNEHCTARFSRGRGPICGALALPFDGYNIARCGRHRICQGHIPGMAKCQEYVYKEKKLCKKCETHNVRLMTGMADGDDPIYEEEDVNEIMNTKGKASSCIGDRVAAQQVASTGQSQPSVRLPGSSNTSSIKGKDRRSIELSNKDASKGWFTHQESMPTEPIAGPMQSRFSSEDRTLKSKKQKPKAEMKTLDRDLPSLTPRVLIPFTNHDPTPTSALFTNKSRNYLDPAANGGASKLKSGGEASSSGVKVKAEKLSITVCSLMQEIDQLKAVIATWAQDGRKDKGLGSVDHVLETQCGERMAPRFFMRDEDCKVEGDDGVEGYKYRKEEEYSEEEVL